MVRRFVCHFFYFLTLFSARQLIGWIKEKKILETIFDAKCFHFELLRRLDLIYILLAKKEKIETKHLDLLYNFVLVIFLTVQLTVIFG